MVSPHDVDPPPPPFQLIAISTLTWLLKHFLWRVSYAPFGWGVIFLIAFGHEMPSENCLSEKMMESPVRPGGQKIDWKNMQAPLGVSPIIRISNVPLRGSLTPCVLNGLSRVPGKFTNDGHVFF